jgi:hypothetical protein
MRLITLCCVIQVSTVGARCRFALDSTCASLLQDPTSFLLQYATAQASFHADGVGLDAASGLTFDGHALSWQTGELLPGGLHAFSAASKEAIHTSLLALALRNNSVAIAAMGGYTAALQVARAKQASYAAFNATLPGYGCHLPWFSVPSMAPVADWAHPARVPALDNGELAWGVFALAAALEDAGEGALASLWGDWFSCMARNAAQMFYQGEGRVAAVAAVRDPGQPPSNNTYAPSGGALLEDPYEGELFTVLLDLFSALPPADKGALWEVKRPRLLPAVYASPSANASITAQVGFWFSAHENWKIAMLPYLELPTASAVLQNCERARTWQAVDARRPGLLASTTDLATQARPIPAAYISAAGIEQLGTQPPPYREDVLPPYGAWLTLLVNKSVGACWLRNVLAAPRAQGPFGASEAVAANGTLFSPLATWDTTMTVVLAAAGGVGVQNGARLRQQGLFARFSDIVEAQYSAAFPEVVGGSAGFGLPAVAIPPDALQPWSTCT